MSAATIDADLLAALNAIGISTGTQVSIVVITSEHNGIFTPHVIRFKAAIGSIIPVIGETLMYLEPATENASAVFNIANDGLQVVAGAIILSVQDASGKWLRSTERLHISDAIYANLYSPSAMTTAVASYQDNSNLNAINSQWYLNLTNNQAFNGTLTRMYMTYDAQGHSIPVVVGVQDVDGGLVYTVFTTDGTSGAKVVINKAGDASDTVTGAMIVAQNPATLVDEWTTAIGQQLPNDNIDL